MRDLTTSGLTLYFAGCQCLLKLFSPENMPPVHPKTLTVTLKKDLVLDLSGKAGIAVKQL